MKSGKNLEILELSEKLTRYMLGGRLTCCKSGKVINLMLIYVSRLGKYIMY